MQINSFSIKIVDMGKKVKKDDKGPPDDVVSK